jgi:hypothetical protein
MNGRIIRARGVAVVVAALSCLLIPSRAALGQAGTSDLLQTTATDPNNINVAPTNTFAIPETAANEGTAVPIQVPAQNILFVNSTTGGSSDYLHVDSFNVTVTSDFEQQLTLRSALGAKVIPSEVFLPVSIFASSDGNPSTAGQFSDRVTIYTGFFGQPNPVAIFNAPIPEPTAETVPEDRVSFVTGGLFFDLLQPGSMTAVSDYVDLPNGITGFFFSSDNPQDFAGLPVDGTIIEDPINGTTVHYSVGFSSDTEVPEPSSTIVLAGLALVGLVALARRRPARFGV